MRASSRRSHHSSSLRARREAAAHGEAFGLERRERGLDLACGSSRAARPARLLRDRAQAFQPAAHDLDAAPRRASTACAHSRRGASIVGSQRRVAARRAWNCGSALGGDPRALRARQRRGAPRAVAAASSSSQPLQPRLRLRLRPRSGNRARPARRAARRRSPRRARPPRARARSPPGRAGRGRRRPPASSQRRAITAWVRRSSSGASSR